MEKKKNSGQSFHILNLISCIFLFGIAFVIIFYVFRHIKIGYKIIYLVMSFAIILIYGILIRYFIIKKYRYSFVRSLNKKYKDENMSYNLYKIDPFLEEKGLTEYQWQGLTRLRILNLFLFIILATTLVLAIIDFNGLLFHDIILPTIMLISVTGISFVLIDFVEEILIRKYYHKHQKKYDKLEYIKKISFLSKNYRIYYIPILLFIGIIIILIVWNIKKDLSEIAKISLVVIILDILLIIILDIFISKTFKIMKIFYDDSKTEIDYDKLKIDENLDKEKESDRDEI